ncbi:MAG: hypothetical protein J0H92_21150 [Sphingobacteriales bacterium]|nr:hypothetical protein [Sphingobacteriales bacterium]OJW31514.1 MAG: hypothetical protein BGO54_13710 [Sphingobacteriales bacterium 46-32]
MEARKKRHIRPGNEYDHLFPSSQNDNKTIRRNANLDHTLDFIPKVVQETIDQTKLIAQRLKGRTNYETCKNIWHFIYGHINYKKDEEGFEQIRSPARAWHDRKQGVDCDCYSVFISSILTNLGIPHILRITKYHREYFQHIYPIVPNDSRHITIDCVTDQFNYEVPFREKKDYPMDLQYLNGFDGDGLAELGRIIERNMHDNTLAGKAKRKAKKAAKAAAKAQAASMPGAPAPKKKKGFFKKVLNVVNKINPATVLLRNGVLAAMKLNIKNVAARLRWSYLTAEQAAAKGIEAAKYQKLLATRQKLENIFYGAGGKPDNLRKAILKGKGNKDKAVSGLGMLPMESWSGYMNENTPLQQLLGPEIYYSENVEGMDGFKGFGELGEPVTLASVGAAMGVIAGIVASLKQIGNIFKGKQQGSEDFDESQTDAPENNVSVPANSAAIPSAATNPIVPTNISAENFSPSLPTTESPSMSNDALVRTPNNVSTASANRELITEDEFIEEKSVSPVTNTNTANTSSNSSDNTGGEKQSFWDKNKKWIKPVAIGVGGLTVIAIAYNLSKGSKHENKASPKSQGLSGTPHKRGKKKKHHNKHQHRKAIALL